MKRTVVVLSVAMFAVLLGVASPALASGYQWAHSNTNPVTSAWHCNYRATGAYNPGA